MTGATLQVRHVAYTDPRVLPMLAELDHERGYTRIYLTRGPRQPEAKSLYLAAGYRPLYDPEVIGPHPFEKALPANVIAERRGCA